MSDIYQHDPNRILIGFATGDLQAWKPDGNDDPSICVSLTAGIKHKGGTQSWVNFTQYMTAAEARSLADVLLRGAGHVDSLLRQEAA